jgi:hypothetical protein
VGNQCRLDPLYQRATLGGSFGVTQVLKELFDFIVLFLQRIKNVCRIGIRIAA